MRAENSKYERISSATESLDSIHVHLVEFGFGPSSGRFVEALAAWAGRRRVPEPIVSAADRQSPRLMELPALDPVIQTAIVKGWG